MTSSQTSSASLDCLVPHILHLSPGLDDDAAPVLDFDVQVMPTEQQHTHQGSAACRIGLDMSRLTVPQDRDVMHVEGHFIVVGQECPAYIGEGQI